jgi:hypothetical protein
MFPYFSGLTFSMAILKSGGWPAFASVFARPPANTQQILHPDLYFANKAATAVKIELPSGVPNADWVLLEENVLGEFGWKEVLKQFLDADGAKSLAAEWDGDAYATLEEKNSKRLMLFTRIHLPDSAAASRFFKRYSELLEKKYSERWHFFQRSNFLSFDSGEGSVYLRCDGKECITLEGGTSSIFLQWLGKLGWPLVPQAPLKSDPSVVQTTNVPLPTSGYTAAAAF